MRGLLMIEPLYHQTIAGKKTMTRRSGGLEQVNGRKATKTQPAIEANPDEWALEPFRYMTTKQVANDVITGMHTHTVTFKNKINGNQKTCTARYKVGEVLYLKEPTRQPAPGTAIWYKYNMVQRERECYKWNNKLFMPAAAARAYIRITGIKCERLLDISDEDCIAEGIEKTESGFYKHYAAEKYKNISAVLPKSSFLSLYKFANKTKEVKNIWVFAYSYDYLKDYKP